MSIFADVQYCIYANIVSGWVKKSPMRRPSIKKSVPYITSAKGPGGWVKKMAIFADVQYCIYADIVGEWVRKSSKIC